MLIEQLSTLWQSAFILFILLLALPLYWCGLIWLISQLSGWRGLAQSYRAQEPPSGKRWSWQYGDFGWAGYNGVLILTANAQGLFIETMWLFSFGHPCLFIPWGEFHHVQLENSSFRRRVSARIGYPTKTTLRLPATVFEQSEGSKLLA